MKNLVFMHLESLNKLNYRVNAERYPFLHRFEQRCNRYPHYYSTATSTLMVLSDLQYGSMLLFEACKSLGDVPEQLSEEKSLFDVLLEEGYTARVLVYPSSGDISGAEKRHFLGKNISAEEIPEYDRYLHEIDKTFDEDKFALHIVPTISNVAENRVVDISGNDGLTCWDEGYNELNSICEHVVEKLDELGKLDDTVIVFYGDHGDDYWGHGLHGGLTHAIEPNNLMISTPLFIWEGKDTVPKVKNEVIQTSDLRVLATNLLRGKEYSSTRRYAFSRNEYAAQEVRKETFNKGYAVADNRYLLLVTALGLEMYDIIMDPACMTNLLKFYDYKCGILSFNIRKNDFKYHIESFWNSRQKRIIRESFYKMHTVLLEEISRVYSSARLLKKYETELSINEVRK